MKWSKLLFQAPAVKNHSKFAGRRPQDAKVYRGYPAVVQGNSSAKVEILWRDQGTIRRKLLPWRTRPVTSQALAEWMDDYLELVAEGYKPAHFASPPLPHCARLVSHGRALAEWRPKGASAARLSPGFFAESPVTADERPGQEGIPAFFRTPMSRTSRADGPSGAVRRFLPRRRLGYPRSLAVDDASTH